MRVLLWAAAIVGLSGIVALFAPQTPTVEAAAPQAKQPPVKAFGIEKRELWTTSKVKGSPEPPNPYQMVRTYPKLKFFEALEIAPVPGKKAWVIAERPGKIITFDADPAKAEPKVVLDV